ncbi:hypothetical protein CGCSCA5_v005687 [Colletotrichum siamense]|nr:hypothetical protein CGCSCA5_v005687 [Colletotrichum siamense]
MLRLQKGTGEELTNSIHTIWKSTSPTSESRRDGRKRDDGRDNERHEDERGWYSSWDLSGLQPPRRRPSGCEPCPSARTLTLRDG